MQVSIFFFNDTATAGIYTLSLHDALPIFRRQHGYDDLHFVAKPLGKHRPDQMIDEACAQRLFFAHPTFAFEEVARNATGSVHLFSVFNCQRQKIAIDR